MQQRISHDFQAHKSPPMPKNIKTDSRKVEEGDWYLPLIGANFDGHQFISKAMDNGAVGFFFQKDKRDKLEAKYRGKGIQVENTLNTLNQVSNATRREFTGHCIGLTGSNGKTTVKEMTASILSEEGLTLKNSGNHNNEIGVPLTLLQLTQNHDFAVIEMGARHEGDIKHLCQIASPTIVGITNVGQAHIGEFGSYEALFKTKTEIYDSECQTIICNYDHKDLYALASKKPKKIITYGKNKKSDILICGEKEANSKHAVTYKIHGQLLVVNFKGYHIHNDTNGAMAAAFSVAANASLPSIKKGLEQYSNPSGRFEVCQGEFGTLIDDSYNANPESMRGGIQTMNHTYPESKLLFVLGDMLELGPQAQKMHAEISQHLTQFKDISLFTVGSLAKEISPPKHARLHKNFENVDDLINYCINVPIQYDVIYVKGSNSIRLSSFVTFVKSPKN